MKKGYLAGVTACVGAVVGAGFASGREIISFFTSTGRWAVPLIALSAASMAGLCLLCLRAAGSGNGERWTALYDRCPRACSAAAQVCTAVALVVTGGAMVAAAGHMVMLVLPWRYAYGVGAVGTLVAAWGVSARGTKPLAWAGGLLTAFFVAVMALLVVRDAALPVVQLQPPKSLPVAAANAVGYAAMNMTLALGVACRCAGRQRSDAAFAAAFGAAVFALLWLGHRLYASHPELTDEVFPVVRLLARFGRSGFVVSVLLLYMAVFSTLAAVMYALRGMVETYVASPNAAMLTTLAMPMALSCVGFGDIVDRLYAPAGLICLFTVFIPPAYCCFWQKNVQIYLDNRRVIQ